MYTQITITELGLNELHFQLYIFVFLLCIIENISKHDGVLGQRDFGLLIIDWLLIIVLRVSIYVWSGDPGSEQ